MTDSDPLDNLIVDDRQPADKALLASLLQGEITVTKDGQVNFGSKFHEYKQWKRMILYFLARKVIALKKLGTNFDEKASLKEIGEGAIMQPTSVSRVIAENLKGLVKSEKGRYYIPNYNLIRCKGILAGNEVPVSKIKKHKDKYNTGADQGEC